MVGLLCPSTGALLITQGRLLQANLITHAVLPGLVLALALDWDPTLGGLASGLLGALFAEVLNRRYRRREDGVMNTILAGFLALGVLLVPLLRLRINLESLLFGDLLAGDFTDLIRTLISAAVLMTLLLFRYKELVFLGVDPEGAIAAQVPVAQLRLLITLITGLVVISALTAVGVVLVIGLLCAPVLIHIDHSKSLSRLIIQSAFTGLILSGSGMILAIMTDLPPGPLIGILCVALLLLKRN